MRHHVRNILLAVTLLAAPALADGPSLLSVGSRTSPPPEGPSLAGARTVVVQCNPYIGGKYSDRGIVSSLWNMIRGAKGNGAVTWDTARRFAAWLAKDCPDAEVVGMEEVIMPDTPEKMRGFLAGATKRPWEVAFEKQGRTDHDSGLAVFWDPARIELVQRFGTVDIARLDSGYVVRFMGVLLRQRASGRAFGMFCGKLVWGGAMIGGHEVTEEQRVVQARTVKEWIARVMAPFPDAGRVIATDLNSGHGSPTYREMAASYESDGSEEPTHSSQDRILGFSLMRRKIDDIWYAPPAYAAGRGFVHPARRSEHFGSDHRAIWSTLRI